MLAVLIGGVATMAVTSYEDAHPGPETPPDVMPQVKVPNVVPEPMNPRRRR